MKSCIFFIFYSLSVCSFAQTGTIQIQDNAGATQLVEKHIYFNKEHNELPGWRIQVFSTNSLSKAQELKAQFLQDNEAYKAAITFEAPNYKLRIGNYNNRFDANRDLQELIVQYPNAFICKDLIKMNE